MLLGPVTWRAKSIICNLCYHVQYNAVVMCSLDSLAPPGESEEAYRLTGSSKRNDHEVDVRDIVTKNSVKVQGS